MHANAVVQEVYGPVYDDTKVLIKLLCWCYFSCTMDAKIHFVLGDFLPKVYDVAISVSRTSRPTSDM